MPTHSPPDEPLLSLGQSGTGQWDGNTFTIPVELWALRARITYFIAVKKTCFVQLGNQLIKALHLWM
jgi:hypothetical protein